MIAIWQSNNCKIVKCPTRHQFFYFFCLISKVWSSNEFNLFMVRVTFYCTYVCKLCLAGCFFCVRVELEIEATSSYFSSPSFLCGKLGTSQWGANWKIYCYLSCMALYMYSTRTCAGTINVHTWWKAKWRAYITTSSWKWKQFRLYTVMH